MKAQNRKAPLQPMRCPSPDLANRSALIGTRAPLQEIKRFNEQGSNFKNPILTKNIVLTSKKQRQQQLIQQKQKEIDALKQQNNQFLTRLQALTSLKLENEYLIVKNTQLINEVQLLKQQSDRIKESGFSYNKHLQPLSCNQQISSNRSQVLKKVLSERVDYSCQQDSKLKKKIQQQSNRIHFLTGENQTLRKDLQFYKRKQVTRPLFQSVNNTPTHEKQEQVVYQQLPQHIKTQIEQSFRCFQLEVEQRYAIYREALQSRVTELENRLQKIRVLQALRDERVNRQIKSKAILNATIQALHKQEDMNVNIASDWKRNLPLPREYISREVSKQDSKYPSSQNGQSESVVMEGQNFLIFNYPVLRQYQSSAKETDSKGQLQKVNLQNVKLRRQVDELSQRLNRAVQNYIQRQKEVHLLNKSVKQLSQLQSLLKKHTKPQFEPSKKSSPQKQHNEAYEIVTETDGIQCYKEKVDYLEAELFTNISKVNDLQEHLAEKNGHIIQLNAALQQNINLFQREMSAMKIMVEKEKRQSSRLQEMTQQLQNTLSSTIRKSSQFQTDWKNAQIQLLQKIGSLETQLHEQHGFLAEILSEHIELIRKIRSGLSSNMQDQGATNFQYLELDKLTFQELKVENDRIAIDLRSKLLLEEQSIIQLKKDKRVLQFEIEEFRNKVQRLQQLVWEISQSRQIPFRTQSELHQFHCRVGDCIEETIQELYQAQQQIKQQRLSPPIEQSHVE